MSTPVLDAELIARAVVAAARVYGVKPEAALTSRGPRSRACLTPAASGVLIALDLKPSCKSSGEPDRVSRAMGLAPMSVYKARVTGRVGAFPAAEFAAEAAARKYLGDRRRAARTPTVSPPAAETPTEFPCHAGGAAAFKTRDVEGAGSSLAGPSTKPPAAQPVRTITPALPPEPPALTLPRRILEVLKDGACNPPGLAILCDAKDLAISQTLAQLERDGLVVKGMIAGGQSRRDQMWRAV